MEEDFEQTEDFEPAQEIDWWGTNEIGWF